MKFKGKNKLSSRELYNSRVLYKGYALSPNELSPVITDIGVRDFNEYSNIFYGKYPFDSTKILKPKAELLVLRNKFYMFNFVAAALDEMLANYETARFQQKLNSEDRYLYAPTIAAGYIDVDGLYASRVRKYAFMFDLHMKILNIKPKIISFKDYAEAFMEFAIESANKLPLSKSQFILSKSVPALCTGLSVYLAGGVDASVDQPKIDDFYRSPNFEFFKNSVINYGFLIDKNVPWILTADLGSPQMKKYLDQFGVNVSLLNGNYSSAFNEVAVNDIDILKNEVINFYSSFVAANPYYKVTELGGYGNQSCSRLVRRNPSAGSPANLQRLRDRFTFDYWVPFYVRLRFAESGLRVDPATVNFVINNALQIYDKKGQTEASRYVQRKTFNIIAVEGSLMHQSKKRRTKNLTDASSSDILDEVRKEVINDKFELF